ncbi:MAG: hypothetical protein JXM70_19325, partial [Pirellulales bacterium]|nr:hypothetical protein [Pirellulales bacterium]
WNLELAPSLWYCFRYTPVTIGTFFISVWRPMVASIVMGAVLSCSSFLIVSQSVFLQVLFSFLVGVGVFILVWIAMPGGVRELRRIYGFASFLIPKRQEVKKQNNGL